MQRSSGDSAQFGQRDEQVRRAQDEEAQVLRFGQGEGNGLLHTGCEIECHL